jgi:hypothetical protein
MMDTMSQKQENVLLALIFAFHVLSLFALNAKVDYTLILMENAATVIMVAPIVKVQLFALSVRVDITSMLSLKRKLYVLVVEELARIVMRLIV